MPSLCVFYHTTAIPLSRGGCSHALWVGPSVYGFESHHKYIRLVLAMDFVFRQGAGYRVFQRYVLEHPPPPTRRPRSGKCRGNPYPAK